jgi:hypothetical protein
MKLFQSMIHYNYFGRLADEGSCSNANYVEERIDFCRYLQNPYPIQQDNIQERCHIIDLSPYMGLSQSIPIGGYSWNWCPVSYQKTSHPDNNPNPVISRRVNVTYGNTYYYSNDAPCNCINNSPHNDYK